MKNLILILAASFLLCGCDNSPTPNQWRVDNIVVTDAERESIAKMQVEILVNVPQTVSGSDQDWEDVVIEASEAAHRACAVNRLWEYEYRGGGNWAKTGRFKPLTEAE